MDVPFWNHSRTLRTAVVASHHRQAGVAPADPACNRGRGWPWSGRERPTWPVVLFC